MRTRVLMTMVAVTVLAVVVFGVPLGVAAARLYRVRELGRLEEAATRAARALPATGLAGDRIELPAAPDHVQVALYDVHGARVAGSGPVAGGTVVRAAIRGHIANDHDGAWLALAVPLQDEEHIVGAVRAAVPWSAVADDARISWLVMAAFGAAACVLAGLVARWQTSRLVAPVEGVTALAVRLGHGEFGADLAPSGVAEIDRAADALNRTSHRLGELLARERAFTADVSHQLNTPLASLRLGLESALITPNADPVLAIERAVLEVERLETTVATLLAVARDALPADTATCDVPSVCEEVADKVRGPLAAAGRPLRVSASSTLPPARFPAAVLREILAVLLDNAMVHGAGPVTISAREAGAGVVVDVQDEGPGVAGTPADVFQRRSPDAAGNGIGLALARTLAETYGGRLELKRAASHPIFTVALPGRGDEDPAQI